jgi:hypothetical protein
MTYNPLWSVAAPTPVRVLASSTATDAIVADVTDIPFATEITDTDNAFSAGVFTAPRAASYVVSVSMSWSGTPGNPAIKLYKNGAFVFSDMTGVNVAGGISTLSCALQLAPGDTVSFRSSTGLTRSGVAIANTLSIVSIG